MYLRVIRNRVQKKNSYIGRICIMVGILFCFKMLINIGSLGDKVLNGKNIVVNEFEEVVYNAYKFVCKKEYSAKSYEYTQEEIVNKTKVASLVGGNSNLYSYIEDNQIIQVVFDDPSYTYGDNNDTILVGATEESESSGKINESMASDENEIASDTAKDEEVPTNVGDLEGYKRPVVAKDGIRYTMDQLSDFNFLMSKLYVVPARAKVLEEELVAAEMLAKDMSLKQDNSKPQILIYHTHSQEGFVDSVKGNPETYIVGVGSYLSKLLTEEYGYNVIHCKEEFDIRNGVLDRSKAYTYAEQTITQILQDYPSIEIVIDVHRDGLKEGAEKLVTTVDGKSVAKIMFFNGVSRSSEQGDIEYLFNRYKKDNLAFSFQLKLAAMECFPEYTRKNYIDAYQYNQHFRAKSVLVEVGAQNNTLQEELNSMEVLAEILHRVIKKK